MTISNEIGEPRYPTIKGIMGAKKKEPVVWKPSDIGGDLNTIGSRTKLGKLYQPVHEAMCEFVEAAGYKSFAASNANEAISILEKNTIHVVITDIMMSGMNGLELTDQIKKNYKADVIVMTGYSADYSYEEAVSKGASDFVFKPIRFEELLLRLKRVLNERKLSEERAEMMKKLNRLATTDGLTRLYNSRSFYNVTQLVYGV